MRGQMMIDALMLVIVLVVIVSGMTLFLGEQAMRTQSLRYPATRHQTALISVLEKEVKLKGIRGRISDILIFQACNGCPTNSELNFCLGLKDEINKTLFEMNGKGQRHYIFASSGLTVYDDKEKVCLDAIPLARQKLAAKCGDVEIIYGSWDHNYDPPEVC